MKNNLAKKIIKINKKRSGLLVVLFLCLFLKTAGAANNDQKAETGNKEGVATDGEETKAQNQNQVKNQGEKSQIKTQEKEKTNNGLSNGENQGHESSNKTQAVKNRFQNQFGKMIQNRILTIEKMEASLGKERLLDEKEMTEIRGKLILAKKNLNQLAGKTNQSATEDPKMIGKEIMANLKELHGYSLVVPQSRGLVMASNGKMITVRIEAALVKIEEMSATNPLPAETQSKIDKLKEDLTALKANITQAQRDLLTIRPAESKEMTKENLESIRGITKNLREQIANIKEQLKFLVPELKTIAKEEQLRNSVQNQNESSAVTPAVLPEDSAANPIDSDL